MMQNQHLFMKSAVQIVLLSFYLITTGCVTLYKPNTIYSPLLKEKGELNTSASLGISGGGLYNLQAGYALSDHIGIVAEGMYHNRIAKTNSNADSGYEKLNILFGEAGAGYFSKFGSEKSGLFQCYGGSGYGSTTDRIYNTTTPNPEVNAKYFNIFIQPGVAYTSKNVELAFDLRANYVQLYKIHSFLYNKFEFWNTDFHYYSDTSLRFINLEPAITIKLGGEKLKGVLQFGATIPAIHPKSYFAVNTSSLLLIPLLKFSLGISFTLGRQ